MPKTSGKILKAKRGKLLSEKRWKKTGIPETIPTETDSALKGCSTDNLPPDCHLEYEDISQPESAAKVHMSAEYIFIQTEALKGMFTNVLCSECHKNNVMAETRNVFGFATKIIIKCHSCDYVLSEVFSSPRIETEKVKTFEINKQMVTAFNRFGRGYAAMENFCLAMNMSIMSHTTYYKLLTSLMVETQIFVKKMLINTRERVRNAHIQENPELSQRPVIDISVTYDGTWHKRGFTSKYGIGCVIDILTGLVVDYEVLSKYCHSCGLAKKELGEGTCEYDIWFEGHSGVCDRNYNGSSPAMEVEAADRLWKRSIENGFRYTTLLSDGDSKTFIHLQEQKLYGDTSISKEECVNHVAKRLGTGLRNAVKEWKAKKVTLGGKSHGSLKEATIVKLTHYYRKAIIDNAPDVNKMKSAIYATLLHCKSTDQSPQHMKCPIGETSWCFFNRAAAKGEKPNLHETEIHTPLDSSVVSKIIPVYQRLASDTILARCSAAKTQNANESLHSIIWSKCPKEIFVSKKKVDLAAAEAVSLVNQGYYMTEKSRAPLESLSDMKKHLSKRRDRRRLQQSSRRSLEIEKRRRHTNRVTKLHEEDALVSREGKTYGAGEF